MTTPTTPFGGAGLHDLSRPIHDGMMVYPGDPEVQVLPGLSLDADGVEVARLRCGTHTGTHLDAPCHTVSGGRTTSEVSWEELVGPAWVLHLDVPARTRVTAEHLLDAAPPLPKSLPPRVLISFGWDRCFGTAQALEHPGLSPDAAELLWARGMRVLGTDALSPDLTVGTQAEFPVHELILGRDGLIVENLTGVRDLSAGEHQIGIFPLPLAEADGAPVRAVAWVS